MGKRVLLPKTIVQLAEQVVATGYSWDAYEFVLRALPRVLTRLHGRDQFRTHVGAAAFCWGLLERAWHQYGSTAADVLESFGLRSSEDIGKVVFGLVAIGCIKAEESDRVEDFAGILDVRAALQGTELPDSEEQIHP